MGPNSEMKRRIRLVILCWIPIILTTACTKDIWNASDLAQWVSDQAVEQGCERESIELEDWYTSENGRNNWHGRCLKQGSDEQMDFSINVDSVWTPSSSG